MNTVIFLDVDGVLNNGKWAEEMYRKGIRVYHDDLLYVASLEQLKRIVDQWDIFFSVFVFLIILELKNILNWQLEVFRYIHCQFQ